MCPVKDCSNRNGECPLAGPALPTHTGSVGTRVTANLVTLAVWAYWLSLPTDSFEVINRLLLSLKRLEDFEDIHGGNLRKTSSVSRYNQSLSSPKAYHCVFFCCGDQVEDLRCGLHGGLDSEPHEQPVHGIRREEAAGHGKLHQEPELNVTRFDPAEPDEDDQRHPAVHADLPGRE